MAQSLKSVGVITLFVEDQQRSKEFYERVFEVTAVNEDEGSVIFNSTTSSYACSRASRPKPSCSGRWPSPIRIRGRAFSWRSSWRTQTRSVPTSPSVESRSSTARPPSLGVRHAAFRDPDGHLWVFSADIPED